MSGPVPMTHCYECGAAIDMRADRHHFANDRILCGDCGEKIRDVMALAAALGLSAYELCAAVMQ